MTEFNSDTLSSSLTTDKELDSFLESTPVPTAELDNFYQKTRFIPPRGGFNKGPGMDKDVSIILDGVEADLDKDEETSTANRERDRYKGGYVCMDRGKDKDVSLILRSSEEDAGSDEERSTVHEITEKIQGKYMEEKDINTAFNGIEKDLGKGKDLSAVLCDVENVQGTGEDVCKVSDSDLCKDKDLSTVLHGVEADLAKDEDQSETAKQHWQTSDPDYLLLEPPEEFRV